LGGLSSSRFRARVSVLLLQWEGFPDRAASVRPAIRSFLKRLHHLETRAVIVSHRSAICALVLLHARAVLSSPLRQSAFRLPPPQLLAQHTEPQTNDLRVRHYRTLINGSKCQVSGIRASTHPRNSHSKPGSEVRICRQTQESCPHSRCYFFLCVVLVTIRGAKWASSRVGLRFRPLSTSSDKLGLSGMLSTSSHRSTRHLGANLSTRKAGSHAYSSIVLQASHWVN
jgi:hypothetical protein